MMENFEGLKKQLSDLASVLNEFKSEAVQLRILDFVLAGTSKLSQRDENEDSERKKKTKRPSSNEQSGATAGQERSSQRKKRGAVGTGAPATLAQLVEDNCFDQPRTIGNIIEHCRHNLARTFKANEFSGKLGRMVRNGALSRKKNADNQYEYEKA